MSRTIEVLVGRSGRAITISFPGPKGDKGDQGDQGDPGTAGPNHLSATTTTALAPGYVKSDGSTVTSAATVPIGDVTGTVPSAQLPIASAGARGAIRVGDNLSIDGDGVLSALPGITSPDAFSFTDQTDVEIGGVISSNTVTLAGGTTVNDTWIVTVSASAGSPQARVNGGTWSDTRTPAVVCRAGDTLQVRVTSGESLQSRAVTVRVGGYSTTWTVTSADLFPSPVARINAVSLGRLWQDSARTTPVTATGQSVQAADDILGGASFVRPTEQGGFWGWPTYEIDSSVPILQFGNNKALRRASVPSANPTTLSVNILWKQDATGEGFKCLFGGSSDAAKSRVLTFPWVQGNQIQFSQSNISLRGYCHDKAYHLISYVYNNGNAIVYLDGVPLCDSTSVTFNDIDQLWMFGSTFNLVTAGTVKCIEYFISSSALTQGQVQSIREYYASQYSAVYLNTEAATVYWMGDSISTPLYSDFPSIPDRACRPVVNKWFNMAVGGIQVANFSNQTVIDLAAANPATKKIAVLFIGTNDIVVGGKTPAQVYTSLTNTRDNLKANGFTHVIVSTPIDRQSYTTEMQSLRDLILAGSGWDGIVNSYTAAGAWNGANFSDGTHLNSTGAAAVAPGFESAISAVL